MEIRILKEPWHSIHPEAVHPLVSPELEDVLHLLDDGGVPVVEVGLLLGEGVVIELLPDLTPLPGRAPEHTQPIVWNTAYELQSDQNC